jgi:integrase
VEQYRVEKMPQRLDTNRGYESWIRVHILPKRGQKVITDLQARPVEMWLESLPLAPKSRIHIRGILSSLWNFAMWKQDIPMQVNPYCTLVAPRRYSIYGAALRVLSRWIW